MHNRKDTSSRTDWDTKQDPPLRPQLKLASGLDSVTQLLSCTTVSVQLCWLVSVRNPTYSNMVISSMEPHMGWCCSVLYPSLL